jgi:hypothetical protein
MPEGCVWRLQDVVYGCGAKAANALNKAGRGFLARRRIKKLQEAAEKLRKQVDQFLLAAERAYVAATRKRRSLLGYQWTYRALTLRVRRVGTRTSRRLWHRFATRMLPGQLNFG